MTTLRLLLDPLLDARPSGTRRTAVSLAREVVRRAPHGTSVEGVLPKVGVDEEEAVSAEIPGLAEVSLARRKRESLTKNWPRGHSLSAAGGGFLHSFSLWAPMKDISLSYGIDQTVVTLEDLAFLTHPELVTPDEVKTKELLLKRAYRFASAIVTPTNAVADELLEHYNFGDRLRVIGGASSRTIRLPDDYDEAEQMAESLGLPDLYVVTLANLEPRHGLEHALRAIARPELEGLKLVVVGQREIPGHSFDELLARTGCPAERVVHLGVIPDPQLAVALQRAAALLVPSLAAGFGHPIVEAFKFGTPVIHSDAPALVEVGMDATLVVERGDLSSFHERLCWAIARVLSDETVERQLRIAGRDRQGVYHWGYSAEQLWTLHADI